jgi:hypothetical protein
MSGPRRIDVAEWQRRFLELDPDRVAEVRYFRHLGDRDWARYLKPPSAFLPYGYRRLARLRYDDDVRALRLWAFVLEEGERVFRARQAGMRVVALMGDYGSVAPLVYAFPDVTVFYPDFCYWTPFLTESDVLLERAARREIGEDTCFVRAAVGAFTSRAHWPEPDLIVASTGASCDDLVAVQQVAVDAGNRVVFLDIPQRKVPAPWLEATRFERDPGLPEGAPPRQEGVLDRLVAGYRSLLSLLEDVLGSPLDPERLEESVERARRIRVKIGAIREASSSAPLCPLPAPEALLVEFTATHFHGDPEECEAVLDGVLDLVTERVEAGVGFGTEEDVRVVWATPPPDPLLHVHLMDRGARVVGTEYLISSALTPLPPGDPVEAVARAFLTGSLLGSSGDRARRVVEEVRRTRAEGVIVSNLFGSSHCGAETPWIRRAVEEECGLPVLAFDVPKPQPGGLGSQVRNRLEAFLEALEQRRRRCATR